MQTLGFALFCMNLRLFSPAKLNLFLHILNRKDCGYHNIQTLFQFLDVGDFITFQLDPTGNFSILNCDNIPLEQNLIYKAFVKLKKVTNSPFGVTIYLEKNIPMGAGLGGGSSNCATTLLALNHLWNTKLSIAQLAKIGLSLGADVPIFINGYASFAQGIGEELTRVELPEHYFVVLQPNIEISTAMIFNHPNLPRNKPAKTWQQLQNEPYHNDCENLVRNLYPEIDLLIKNLAPFANFQLTGTGACIFSICENYQKAQQIFNYKPSNINGFIARGCNVSLLNNQLKDIYARY